MKAKYHSIFISGFLLLIGVLTAGVVLGDTSAELSVTVTAKNISVSVSDGSVAFGTLQLSTVTNTIGIVETQDVANNGTETENISIYCSDAVGGTGWELAAASGANEFLMEFSTSTGASWTAMNVDNATVSLAFPALASSGTGDLDLQISMPSSSDTVEKTITLTLVATEAA